ncbi:MAG: class I SAM-dependent methyltransferase [Candidatus Paceibacterota bacterium]|jgi:SAM-dependent methyltransferase
MAIKNNYSRNVDQTYFFGNHIPKGRFFGDITAPEIIKLSKKYLGKKILDIGSGSGALIDLLPKNTIGLDLIPGHPKVIEGSIDKMPFNDNKFDTVFCIEVLEHLDEAVLRNGLKEIFRVLDKNGKFILTVPFDEDLKMFTVTCPNCGNQFHRIGHLRSFDKITVEDLLSSLGFRINVIKIIPIGIISRYPLIKHLLFFFNRLIPSSSKNIFAIASKA